MPGKRSRPLESKISVDRSSYALFNNFCVFIGLSSPRDQGTHRPSYSESPEAVGLGIVAALCDNNNEISKARVVSSNNLAYRISTAKTVKNWWPSGDKPQLHDYKKMKENSTVDYSDSMPSISIDVDEGYVPPADFLYSCYLCRSRLSHQKDIYMYKGDKAFCSQECRYQQIFSDEEKERNLSASKYCCGSSSSSSSSIFTCVP